MALVNTRMAPGVLQDVGPTLDLGLTATMAEPASDAHLVAAARAGDRDAFGQLYDRYGRMVHGILLARVPRYDVADLVHDVFLLALRQLETLRDDRAFGGWLSAIARHRAADHLRGAPDETSIPEELPGMDPARQEGRWVLRTIRSLPEAYRETLVLRLVEGMTGPEIAARTGLTPGSVRVNLHRGMKQLRQKLGLPALEPET
ncbi:MAG TPA: sigma-70 family RNA polymerase sigma factor [Candidatus Polarisedimenticolaceae bacterium]|nr:sigma-70 family RNA polymerase sigma factor [Candidatus Polarisedimenticolaceae bacterium]